MNTNHQLAVGEFARSVRAHLSDLPALDVEELTEGLEADLAERLAEDGSDLGDPAAYAAELRASAGLCAKAAEPVGVSFFVSLRAKARETIAALRAHQSTASLLDFMLALRPVWWVLRGWIVFSVLVVLVSQEWALVPRNFFESILWVALVIVSIQWGRGRWLGTGQIGTALRATVSVGAAVLLLPLAVISYDTVNQALNYRSYDYASSASPAEGLSLDGNNVSNIFAYDCSGQPLRNVQLFSEDGTKLSVEPFGDGYSSYPNKELQEDVFGIPSQFVAAREGWNVFPLDATVKNPYESDESAESDLGRVQAPLPFDTVQPLLNECAPEAPKGKEAALPSTMPTGPTLNPADVKSTDSGATENGSPLPAPEKREPEAPKAKESGAQEPTPPTPTPTSTPSASSTPPKG